MKDIFHLGELRDKMPDRSKVIPVLLWTGTILSGVFVFYSFHIKPVVERSLGVPNPDDQKTPKPDATETVSNAVVPIFNGEFITDPETGTKFKVVNIGDTKCIELGEVKADDPNTPVDETDLQTVFRASKNLIQFFKSDGLQNTPVHGPAPDANYLGVFPGSDDLDLVPIGALVCPIVIVKPQP